MSDVKWIKITTDIFDDEKILLIESMPEADSLIVIWFKLLCLAGKQNNHGVFVMSDRIAYTDKMLATIFRRKESTVQLAFKTFQEFGMIDIIDGVITIPNWGKHQTLDKLERKSEYMREYMRGYREKQRMQIAGESEECKSNSNSNGKSNVSRQELELEKDTDIDTEIEKDTEIEQEPEVVIDKINYSQIVDLYNSICVSYPRLRVLSDARKKAIGARLKVYSLKDIEEVFRKAEASNFLKGSNDRDWRATFDWLLKDRNMAKVLEGYYDNREGRHGNGGAFGEVSGKWKLRADVE